MLTYNELQILNHLAALAPNMKMNKFKHLAKKINKVIYSTKPIESNAKTIEALQSLSYDQYSWYKLLTEADYDVLERCLDEARL